MGVGSSLFVLSLPVLAMRLHAPPASAMIAIMITVTTVLVVGYSIIDTRLARVGNPGVGYNVAWRRGLLVIIGAVSAFLRPCYPYPLEIKFTDGDYVLFRPSDSSS